MFAIKNTRTKKWVYGTDFRYPSPNQRTSFEQALTYADLFQARIDFKHRQCGNDYEIVKVKLIEMKGEDE